VSEPEFLSTTRSGYNARAEEYHDLVRETWGENLFDLAMLDVFAGLVKAVEPRKVADIGCGPGHVTAHLRTLGLDAAGIDLSPELLAIARREHPEVPYSEGTMTALDLPDASLGGVLARWSIIHTPPEQLPEVFAEFSRVLVPGGVLLLGFFAHTNDSRIGWQFDHTVAPAWRLSTNRLARLLEEAGFREKARLIESASPHSKRGFEAGHLLLHKEQP
jgi:ubiquinone/menaquinone biosynthesis C-methylase UbiE